MTGLRLPDQLVRSRSEHEPYCAVGVVTQCYPNRIFNPDDYDANPKRAYFKFLRAIYRMRAVEAWQRCNRTFAETSNEVSEDCKLRSRQR